MKIALIQAPLTWQNADKNIEYFSSVLNNLEKDVDLVVLPEMFASGFTMHPEKVFTTLDGLLVQWMQKVCKTHQFALIGSVVVKEDNLFYNRLFFVFPDGSFKTYDKRHLFSLAGEEKVYEKGKQRLIVQYKGWNICPLICYDLRFPIFARNADSVYDLLIYVANWPNQRIYAWDTIMKARAIENMSYVVGVNRCGKDDDGNCYSGHSQVIDFMGHYILEPIEGEQIAYVILEKAPQEKARTRFGFLKDVDRIEMK